MNSAVCTDIGYFKGTFSLKVKEDAELYQALPRCVAYTLQEELERLQEQEILAPLG